MRHASSCAVLLAALAVAGCQGSPATAPATALANARDAAAGARARRAPRPPAPDDSLPFVWEPQPVPADSVTDLP